MSLPETIFVGNPTLHLPRVRVCVCVYVCMCVGHVSRGGGREGDGNLIAREGNYPMLSDGAS